MINQFNVNEVKSNGVGGQGYQAVLVHKDAIVEICKEVRDLLGLDKIFELITKDETNDYYRGHRFEEVEVTVVVDACRDCAGADHWYAFEKDWG